MDLLDSLAFRDWLARFLVVLFLVGGFALLAVVRNPFHRTGACGDRGQVSTIVQATGKGS
jgi:hypothetical protein